MPFEDGPFIAAALLCERVLTEADATQSAIRIVDRVTAQVITTGPADSPPAQFQGVQVTLWALIILKNGKAAGSHRLVVTPIAPSGLRMGSTGNDVLFEGGEDRGVSITAPVQFVAQEEGVYWFDVSLDDTRLTRVPLRIIVQRQSVTFLPGY